MSHFCSRRSDVSGIAPSITFTAELSIYSPKYFVSNEDVAGDTSDGFKTTVFPAAIAPMTGSSDSTANGIVFQGGEKGYSKLCIELIMYFQIATLHEKILLLTKSLTTPYKKF